MYSRLLGPAREENTAVRSFVNACCLGDVLVASHLIAEGVDINGKCGDTTGLIGAVVLNNREIMKLLLARPDIDVNIRDSYGCTAYRKEIALLRRG